jgi:hypothetical protein
MSQLVYELGQIVDRILFVSPSEKRLNQIFKLIADDLTMNIGARQKLNFVSTRLEGGPLKCWMAFDLGTRAQLKARIQMLGVTLDSSRYPNPSLIQANEALVLDWDPGNPEDDRLLTLPITQHNKERPCMALLRNARFDEKLSDPSYLLRAKAQKQGLEESYKKFLISPDPEDFLRQGLEWILSF